MRVFTALISLLLSLQLSAMTVSYTDTQQSREQIVRDVQAELEPLSFYSLWKNNLRGEDPTAHILKSLQDCPLCTPPVYGICAGEAFAIQAALYRHPNHEIVEPSYRNNIAYSALRTIFSETKKLLWAMQQAGMIDTTTHAFYEQQLFNSFDQQMQKWLPEAQLVARIRQQVDLMNDEPGAEKFIRELLELSATNGHLVTAHVHIGSGTNIYHAMLIEVSAPDYHYFDSYLPGHVVGTYPDIPTLTHDLVNRIKDVYFSQSDSPQPGSGFIELVIYSDRPKDEL